MNTIAKSIFDAFVAEVLSEDKLLISLFEKNAYLYEDNMSFGVNILFEHVFVYLCLRGCLRRQVPARLSWEQQYPSNAYLHADLAVYVEKTLSALIEFKVWTREDVFEIKKDVQKLSSEKKIASKWIVVIAVGGTVEGSKKLLAEQLSMKPTQESFGSTDVLVDGIHEKRLLAFYLLET